MNMVVSLKSGGSPEFKSSVDTNQLAKKLGPILRHENSHGYRLQDDKWSQAVIELLPETPGSVSLEELGLVMVEPHPNVWQTYSDKWIALSMGNPAEWFFYYNRGAGYQLVEVPRECRVSREGNISVDCDYGRMLVGHPKEGDTKPDPAWPWVLLQPRAWLAHRELSNLLFPDDEHPLTILLRSGFPTKGNALQLKRALENVERSLKSGLTT